MIRKHSDATDSVADSVGAPFDGYGEAGMASLLARLSTLIGLNDEGDVQHASGSESAKANDVAEVPDFDLGLMLELFANISTAQYCEQQSSRQHRHKRTTYPDSSTHQRERTQNKTNLPQHDVTVLIHTCDAYSHLWKVSEKKYCLYKMCLNCD